MALVELPDVAVGIAAVEPAEVARVRDGVPVKLASVRTLVRGGRLGGLKPLVENVGAMLELLADRDYPPVPWRTTAAIVFALGYFLMTIDVIPDFVPVLGFVDDALVVAEVVLLLAGDLERYRVWRAARGAPRPSEKPGAETVSFSRAREAPGAKHPRYRRHV